MKLYSTFPAHFVSYTPLITAKLCNSPVEQIYCPPDSELAKSEEMIARKGIWNFPLMETADGKVFSQSVAVATYIAREAGRTDLFGSNAFEEAQIDQFNCISQASIFPLSYKIGLTTFGWIQDPAVHAAAVKDVKDVMQKLNKALDGKEYLVGGHLTLADITVFVACFMTMELALDAGFRKAMPHFSAWYERITKVPEVVKVCGHLKLPAKGLKPASK
jgi:glutathione S-transferase